MGAIGGGFAGVMRAVDVAEDAGCVPIELRPPPPAEAATVQVRLRGDAGELRASWNLGVHLEDPATGAVIARHRTLDRGPPTFTVPPGRYRVVAAGTPYLESSHGTLMRPRELGRAEREVTLAAGVTEEVALSIPAGARLHLHLTGEADAADRAAILDGESWLQEQTDLLDARSRTARVSLLRPGHAAVVVYRTLETTGDSAAGIHLESGWPLGQPLPSQVVPNGRFTLVARLPGGREARTDVNLEPGQTTPVALRF